MRLSLTIFGFLLAICCFGQGGNSVDIKRGKIPKRVSFVTKIDIQSATKDGIYLNGYVVNIGYEKAKALDGKTVRIKGRVTIVREINNSADGEVAQGRQGNTIHILSPRIKIISK